MTQQVYVSKGTLTRDIHLKEGVESNCEVVTHSNQHTYIAEITIIFRCQKKQSSYDYYIQMNGKQINMWTPKGNTLLQRGKGKAKENNTNNLLDKQ